jgi:DNA polymerase elongation subunit (family B)
MTKSIDQLENELRILKDKSQSYKILLNSMYGIQAVPYSRYFNLDMAEAITSCARHTIQMGELYSNDILNDKNNEEMNKIIEEIKNI